MAELNKQQKRSLSTTVDGAVFDRFKLICTAKKQSISDVISGLMTQYVEDNKGCLAEEVRILTTGQD